MLLQEAPRLLRKTPPTNEKLLTAPANRQVRSYRRGAAMTTAPAASQLEGLSSVHAGTRRHDVNAGRGGHSAVVK